MTTLRAITLDLDDTLWPVGPTLIAAERVLGEWLDAHAPRTAAASDAASRAAIRARLVERHPDRAHDMSFLRREGLRIAMAAAGDDPALADPAFEVFLEARQRVMPFDDVEPVLERWAARYRLVAVTNGNADVARTVLGRYFSGSVGAHEIGCAKPDPRMFVAACRIAGVAPAEALHVGDEPELDVLGAHRAGLRAAWLRRPSFAHRHPADACGPDHPGPFEDLHALDAWLAATHG
ncbi:MAG TPA: HAD family hydrolase [Burkholderiaceae bacterium]|nr:HAD family hydrolase [Burkholderiaceae bacterium]